MKSVYPERLWLKHYPSEIPAEIEIPVKSLNEAFNEATEKWTNKTAMIFYGTKINYKKLRDKVDRLANSLFHLGIKKGDKVALLMLNSPEYIVAFYAILKVGATVTAISPVYVSSEIKYQLEDSGAENIICHDILYEGVEKTELKLKNIILARISDSLPALKKFIGKSILRSVYQKMSSPSPEIFEQERFHKFQDLIKNYPPNPPQIGVNPFEDLVVLAYTGGTTGPPKGAMVTHYNVMASVTNFSSFFPFLEEGKELFVSYMPFYHAGGQFFTVMRAILQGYTQIIITTPEIDDILHAVIQYGATFFVGTPALYEIIKDYEKRDRVNWKKLKGVVSVADTLHEVTASEWKDRTGTILYDLYGMTEFNMSHASPVGKQKISSIGIPICNTIGAIMDPDENQFLPPGELGELVVSGPQVTKGYWNKPEATKECEAVIDGIRWWRTGDLAKMEEDGYFYIYDRKRDLIKYKGLRIYSREVEEVLKGHPQIKEVGVIGVRDIKVGQIVKAFIVLESDARGKVSEADIIQYCEGKLAPYKIPKILEFTGEIPKTDVGKVSHRELREMETQE